MTTYPDNLLLPISRQLLQCLRDEAPQNPSPPGIVGFRTGTTGQVLAGLAEDECCEGAAFVRVLRVYPSWGVPSTANLPQRCGQPRAAEFELSMWRCNSIGDINEPPSQDDWDCLHVDLLNDRVMLQAAACCFVNLRERGSVLVGDWTLVPTEGGCVGSTLSVQVDLLGGTR